MIRLPEKEKKTLTRCEQTHQFWDHDPIIPNGMVPQTNPGIHPGFDHILNLVVFSSFFFWRAWRSRGLFLAKLAQFGRSGTEGPEVMEAMPIAFFGSPVFFE